MDALELSSPTQFGLSATPIQQSWVESKTLKCALFAQIRCFPLGQAVLPERHGVIHLLWDKRAQLV